MECRHLTCDLIGCVKRKKIGEGSSGNPIYYCPIRDAIIGEEAYACSECLKTRPQLVQYWKKRDLLGEKILRSLVSGPKSVSEIAESIGVKKEAIGLKIKRELEALRIIKYDNGRKKWELNV